MADIQINRATQADKRMVSISSITKFLTDFAPVSLAEEWDNVGLLVGDNARTTSSIMTCLTLTSEVATEAIQKKAKLIVSHHPILFRAVQQLTTETAEGEMLLALIEAGVSVYCPHTGYDSAPEGINQQLAELFGLHHIGVLRPRVSNDHSTADLQQSGAGRFGLLPTPVTLGEFNQMVKDRLGVEHLNYVGDEATCIRQVGIACGSAAEFLSEAHTLGCDLLLTGEARFHACLLARTRGIAMVLPGHYATERPAIEHLASVIAREFPALTVWASESESDPLEWG